MPANLILRCLAMSAGLWALSWLLLSRTSGTPAGKYPAIDPREAVDESFPASDPPAR